MTRYNAEFPFPIAFPPTSMDNVLAEWLAKQGVKQCHVAGTFRLGAPLQSISNPLPTPAETEKYAHVTFFFTTSNPR
jgi:2,3-bisphosphoglycerate-independent phosphoglycerate mutase